MKAINLNTEFLQNPIGIDVQNPRLMWTCEGGIAQTAYRIMATHNDNTVWDSGKVLTDSMRAEYPLPLASCQRIVWKVMLWDENNLAGQWSDEAYFEAGLLQAQDFVARWITGNYRVDKRNRYPVDCFKKQFVAKNIVKARLYVTACGLYEVVLNGRRAGDFVLAPGHTDYTKRIQLQTYDVTELIVDGNNTVTAQLADGWYRGSCGAWGRRNQYGKETKLWLQLQLTDKAGNVSLVVSDGSWLWSNDGEIRFADNKDGEIVNAMYSPSYKGKAKLSNCKILPCASNNVPLAEHEHFTHPKVITTPSGKKVLDFRQNIAGYIKFKINAFAGQQLHLRFGEMLGQNGELSLKNIQCANKKRTKVTPLQQIIYTCKDGANIYKTKFAIFGFQYVEVQGNAKWNSEDFEAIAVYSDMRQTMSFECSHPLINQFVKSTLWSAKNNHADVPTDCPTRERHGWTGDAQIFVKTASYLFNYDSFARKYIRDMCDGQRRSGCYRQISPKGGTDFYMNNMDGSAGWSDAGILIPYRLWKQYGDLRILKENYDSMRRYAIFKLKTLGKWYLTARPTGIAFKYRKYISNYGQSYGEWAEPTDVNAFHISDFICPHPEETTAYIVYMLSHIAEIAKVLGKDNDSRLFTQYAQKARTGYQKLVSTAKFSLDTDRQAKLVRPLYMDLLDDEQKNYATKRLVKALDRYGWRLGTGFLSTPFILYVLQDIDKEYAYRLLENEQMPGWLFMPKMGANTIWESWEGTEAQGGIASLDHYSKGALCEWLFSQMCGINVDGVNHFKISPLPGGSITYAGAKYESVYGTVSCSWQKTEENYIYKITVPSNCTAEIVLCDGRKYTVGAGEYIY